MKNILLITFILLFLMAIPIYPYNNETGAKMAQEDISFNVAEKEYKFVLSKEMPIEIIVTNHSGHPIKFRKNYSGQDNLLFKLILNEKHLINDEIKSKHNLSILKVAKIGDSPPDFFITLKPGEKYKLKVDISDMVDELVKDLNLECGTYNVRLVYTMWIQILKEKPEYAKNKNGKTREWKSNEFTINLVEKGKL